MIINTDVDIVRPTFHKEVNEHTYYWTILCCLANLGYSSTCIYCKLSKTWFDRVIVDKMKTVTMLTGPAVIITETDLELVRRRSDRDSLPAVVRGTAQCVAGGRRPQQVRVEQAR